MWFFRQEDPELRALRKQLKEAEASVKRVKIESDARIKQIQEEARQWHIENEARSRAQQEEFFRKIEELAQESGHTVEQLYEQIRTKMQADLDQLTRKENMPGKEKQTPENDNQST
jgi:predicted DNA-binding ribbon-helix-helix protein